MWAIFEATLGSTMTVLILVLTSLLSGNDKELRVTEDLKSNWKIIIDGKFGPYGGHSDKTIHFSTDLKRTDGAFLLIQSKKKFYLFINSYLIVQTHKLKLSADSLGKIYGKNIFVSVHQSTGISDLSTQWLINTSRSQFYNPLRPAKTFQNFVLLAVLFLIILLTWLLRSNPQLTLDYLNVIKLFSFRHRDDSQFVLRITSSVNLLLYIFCSLLTALALLIAMNNSKELSISIDLESRSTEIFFVQWLIIALFIAGLLILKLGLASTLSILFEWRDTAGFQFFNFVRVLVLSLMLVGVISIFCFSMNINLNYYFLAKCFCTMLSMGAGLMFFKLLNRESSSPFHLFSYLCATEIFPLVILIKVFLF
jgi:hypothetical protein